MPRASDRQQSLYERIASSWGTVRGSAFPHEDGQGSAGSTRQDDGYTGWDGGHYRSPVERVEHEGNPESWGVLLTASLLARQSGAGASERSSPRWTSTGGTTSRASLSGVRTTSGSRDRKEARKRARTLTTSTLHEEPESYAAVEAHSVEGGSETSPDEWGGAEGVLSDEDGTEVADDATDSDSDSPLLSSPESSPSAPSTPSPFHRLYSRIFPLSSLTRNVLKCVLAYFLASLFTYVPVLSDAIGAPWDVEGPVRNAHVVATVAVYFMPARTVGGMLEADAYLSVGALYATFLTCGSMACTVLFERLDMLRLGHAVVLILWLGCGYGLAAYVKVVMNKPSISTACSLVSLICSGFITKEGAYHQGLFRTRAIEQVLAIALIGSIISNAVCFLLWPQSATDKLQCDLNKTLTSFGTLVEMLTKTFLLDLDAFPASSTDFSVRPDALKKAIDAHQASFTSLSTSLSQARWEVFDSRISGSHLTRAYDEVVSSMTRLAQGLTGMRAGCALQWEIIRAREEGTLPQPGEQKVGKAEAVLLDEIAVLERFKEHVGPSLEGLAQTSVATLKLLRTSFMRTSAGTAARKALHLDDPEAAPLPAEGLVKLKEELDTALGVFKREHSRGVKILYHSLPAQTMYGGEDASALPESAGKPEPNDNLFRIYHFCFNFEEWAAELLGLVSVFISLRETEEAVERETVERRRRWGILAVPVKVLAGIFGSGRRGGKATQLGEQFARAMKPPRKKRHSVFPEIVDGALSSHQIDVSKHSHSLIARAKLAFWYLGWHLRQPDIRFAIKTGAGVAILSSAAFIPALRPIWLEWRGEWSLISYFIVCAPAMGDANFLAFGRVMGTLSGAAVAVACYTAFPENPYVLPLLGALFSAPCFYVAVSRPALAPSSRFVLLTFNLTCLYCFNLREVDLPVVSIALHRVVAVVVGVLWGLVLTTYVWPFEARRELRHGLAEFFLNSSYLYECLVRLNSAPPPALSRAGSPRQHRDASERTSLLPQHAQRELAEASEDFVAMEIELQLLLIKVSGLLAATRHEPRLKGPFPVQEYRAVLASCQTILDSLTAVARMTNREAWFSSVRREYILPVRRERREMVGNVILFFSILSSAVSIKQPLPPYLPPAAEARERLVAKIRDLEVVKRRIVRGGSESMLYYAYTTTVKDIIRELEVVGSIFQRRLFGIIGGSTVDSFEDLFREQLDRVDELSDNEDDSRSSDERPTPS
ncbi:hypothetical protein JCM10213v2_001957 [Rhodosporidiobolus nylandii]